MRTPKELFQTSPHFQPFQKLLESPSFEPACQTALMVLVDQFPAHTGTMNESWDAHCQIVGARRVLQILSTLHQPDVPFKQPEWPSLNYAANQPKTT